MWMPFCFVLPGGGRTAVRYARVCKHGSYMETRDVAPQDSDILVSEWTMIVPLDEAGVPGQASFCAFRTENPDLTRMQLDSAKESTNGRDDSRMLPRDDRQQVWRSCPAFVDTAKELLDDLRLSFGC